MEVPSNLAFCTVNDIVMQLDWDKVATIGIAVGEQALVDNLASNFKQNAKDFILETSAKIVSLKHRFFLPILATVTLPPEKQCWQTKKNGILLNLDRIEYADLLSITSVTVNGEVISASYYRPIAYADTPANYGILFDRNNFTIPSNDNFSDSVVIVGTWGYHRSPSAMWSSIAGTLTAGLNSSDTTFVATLGTVANFPTYGYIKIDSEVLFITSVLSATPYTITVQRGALGTTAASHLIAASIYNFVPMEDVVKACKSHVIRKLANMPEYNKVTVIGDSLVNLGSGMEIELNIPAREYWGAV